LLIDAEPGRLIPGRKGSQMGNRIQIGWRIVKEDFVGRNTYECAAWFEDVAIMAGRYPLYGEVHWEYDRNNGSSVCMNEIKSYPTSVKMEGIITGDYFGSLFCGVPISTYDHQKNVGKSSEYFECAYAYNIAESILKGNGEYELLPGFEAQEVKFTSTFDGLEHTTHKIACVS
jgi:hypothetical protein